MGNKKQSEKQSETEINQKIKELGEAVKTYNDIAAVLRDKLRSSVPIPFKLDPILSFTVVLGETIPVDKYIAMEFFGKKFMEITDVKVGHQSIIIFFKDEDGKSVIYNIVLHDGIETIELWEAYLLSLIADHIKQPINMERKQIEAFLDKIMETTGEDNE